MTVPATIRVNTAVPFPAFVRGDGVITVTKLLGVWIVGLSQATISSIITTLINAAMAAFARPQRSVTASPIVINVTTDDILNININAGAPTCALPTAASRLGRPLTFNDAGAHVAAHNVTLTPNGAETISGAASFTMTNNRQVVTIVPYNDGVNTGWYIS